MHVPGTTLVLKNTIKFCSHAYGVKQFVTTEQCDTMTVDTLHFTINNALTRHSPAYYTCAHVPTYGTK